MAIALLPRGHAFGEGDGMLRSASRVAVAAAQCRPGWPDDGRAGPKLLRALQPPCG